MREIVLDTETTGMDPVKGDRLVEIGCVELMNHLPTGKHYHVYINPERDIPPEATAVHGITNDFVKDKPTFGEVVGGFMDFIGESRLVIHNAEFDVKFLNAELKLFGFPSLDNRRVFDTLRMAREKFPGSPANLDALCRRFGIDNSSRTFHGALLDSQLLAEVYLEMLGGRQQGLGIVEEAQKTTASAIAADRPYREPRIFTITDEEKAAHEALLEKLKNPLWKAN
ncbi:MAG: DNA polymerase III subunit epsilon [Micavibrio aeruginosavorus]|uniref:DNA polymerase III subunit epsilon n=1 Tax=Micavibrio aeruginosavorus TaxID=349221 RepID=A0A2W5BM03_9BACT|nr:MAG: DNA polymerase III subunit epsilon [Micavibrio aeruginosavorus]